METILKSLDTAYFSVISALTTAMEQKDRYTQGHAERVTELVLKIGNEMKLTTEEQLHLQYAAVLHDIGKLALPDNILLKPKSLNNDERKFILKHPLISEEIANKSPFLEKALPGIRYHHERYDGLGYPEGLRGEEIPLLARIIAVADAFDAMTTTRPYRFAKPVEQAIAEITDLRGTQFDPVVVAAFLRVMARQSFKPSGVTITKQ